MEEKRLQVTPETIEAHFANLFEFVQGVQTDFVFNMDETGHQEWTDKQSKVWHCTCCLTL